MINKIALNLCIELIRRLYDGHIISKDKINNMDPKKGLSRSALSKSFQQSATNTVFTALGNGKV